MRKYAVLCMFLCLMAVLTLPAAAAAGDVTSGTVKIGSSTAQVVYVDMNDPDYALVPLVANGSIHTDAPASSVIEAADGGSVVAAINGGFFNSYYKTNSEISVVTNNYPRVYSTIVSEGQVICAGGEIAAIGMDYDGDIYMDVVKISPTITLRGSVVVTAWGVNVQYNDASAVYVLTDLIDYAVNIPADARIVTIENDKVTSVTAGHDGYTVPDGVIALVYGSGAYANATKWETQPNVGDSAVLGYRAALSDGSSSAVWSNMRTVVAGGGILVKDGVNVVTHSVNPTADDQQPDIVGQRSFAAITGDGKLMLGVVTSSFRTIANSLIEMGVKDAIFMDGGASSMLYANGSTIVSAGRELATILAVVDESPEESATQVPAASPFSDLSAEKDWYYDEVVDLVSRGVVSGYGDGTFRGTTAINRAQALKLTLLAAGYAEQPKTGTSWASGYYDLAVREGMIEDEWTELSVRATRLDIARLACAALGLRDPGIESPFADIDDPAVNALYVAGIFRGKYNSAGELVFSPDSGLYRGETCVIIWRILEWMANGG